MVVALRLVVLKVVAELVGELVWLVDAELVAVEVSVVLWVAAARVVLEVVAELVHVGSSSGS